MMGWGVGNSLTSGASIVGCVPYHTRQYQTIPGHTKPWPLLDQRPIWGRKSGVERMVWLRKTVILIIVIIISFIMIMIYH